jgi:hypothetical protein
MALRFAKSILIGSLLLLAACQHMPMPTLVIKPSPAEIALQELATKETAKNKELQAKIDNAELTFKQKYEANVSLGAASVMAGLDTLNAEPNKTKYTLAAIPALEVAVTALPQPSLEDYKKTSETQRKLLSELASEVQKGKEEIAAQKGEALAAKEAQRKALEEKARIEKEKSDFAATVASEKEKLNNENIKFKNDALIASENARALQAAEETRKLAEANSKKDMQQKLIYIFMGFGLLAAVASYLVKSPGALFNPLLGMVAAASVGLAIALSFVPTWVIATISGVLVVGAGVALFLSFKDFKDVAEVAVGGVQEHKNEDPQGFKAGVAKKLDEWSAHNPKIRDQIDKLAKQLNVK